MAQTTGQNLPPPQVPFVNKNLTLSDDGYQFLIGFLTSAASATSTASVDASLAAKGNNQATALQLNSQWNEVDTTPAGSGVLLSAMQPGQSQTVFNQGANALNIYPAPGFKIDALATNGAFSLGIGLRRTFDFISTTQIR